MPKIFLSLLLIVSTLLLAEGGKEEAKTVVLHAESIREQGSFLYASGRVTLEYAATHFTAERASYDRQNKLLVIQGNVQIRNPNGSEITANKITLDVAEKSVHFKKFFYSDTANDETNETIWIRATKAKKKKKCYELEEALFSSCSEDNPDWHFAFSEANYNAETKRMKLKDIKFYVGDIPVFYFPYLAFSTARERSSGILMPHVGYNTKSGFYYEQPLFLVMGSGLDLEINPQLRTKQNTGLYSTLRFADTAYSEGSIRMGYFKDMESYATRYNLENDEHYGFEIKYDSSHFMGDERPAGYRDGLYVNLLYFNDIDYLNLQRDLLDHLSDSHLKESRINYLLYDENNYFGVNAHLFLDAEKKSNAATLQEIPSLRWHRFANALGSDNILWGADLNLHNYTRSSGSKAQQLEATLPLSYNFSLVRDYIRVSLREELYAHASDFSDTGTPAEEYSALWATHSLALSGDMIRPYDTGTHTINWSLTYAKQQHNEGAVPYGDLNATVRRDYMNYDTFDTRATLALGHYWHDYDTALRAKQRIAQTYHPDRSEKWGNLYHELRLDGEEWHWTNSFDYSFEHRELAKLSNKLEFERDQVQMGIEHFWRKSLSDNTILSNEVALDLKYAYSDELSFQGAVTYDLEQSKSKTWEAGLLYDRGCWSLQATYEHDIKPILEQSGGGFINNNTFMVKINLIPFNGSGSESTKN